MCKRDYTADKKPLTIDEQISLLTERGLQGEESQIRQALNLMTYYHFSGFCFHFLQKDEAGNILDKFINGTNISHIIRRYQFDLNLRHLLFVAIDHIETFCVVPGWNRHVINSTHSIIQNLRIITTGQSIPERSMISRKRQSLNMNIEERNLL